MSYPAPENIKSTQENYENDHFFSRFEIHKEVKYRKTEKTLKFNKKRERNNIFVFIFTVKTDVLFFLNLRPCSILTQNSSFWKSFVALL